MERRPGFAQPGSGVFTAQGLRVAALRVLSCVAVVAVAAAFAPAWGQSAAAPAPIAERLHALQVLAGADPSRVRSQIPGLRDAAIHAGQLGLRLGVDELECRLLIDFDLSEAIRVSAAGIAAGRDQAASGAAQLPWLRLRACRATALLDGVDPAAGARARSTTCWRCRRPTP